MKSLTIKGIDLFENKARTCISLVAKTFSDMKDEIEQLVDNDVDIVEWRIDLYEEDLKQCSEYLSQVLNNYILIYTIRSIREGGFFKGSIEEQCTLLKKMILLQHCDMIDFEYSLQQQNIQKLISFAKYHQINCILSCHDFKKTPSYEQLIAQYVRMEQLQADIVKIACMPNTKQDVFRLMQASIWASHHLQVPIVSISMGSLGMITRVFANYIGSCFSFASLKNASAPGQIPVDELVQIFHMLEMNL